MDELIQSSTSIRKINKLKKRKQKRKAVSMIAVIFAVVLFGGAFLYGHFSIGKDNKNISFKNAKKEEMQAKNRAIKGEFDKNKQTDNRQVVSKYSFPIPKYKPIRKKDATDLSVPNAHAAVILDADSGVLLYYKNGEQERQVASLTKLMTAILVMENIEDLDNEAVAIDSEAVFAEGTKIGCPRSGYCIGNRLRVGEVISAKSLLKAMLMNSANDSAIALGKHIGGSQEKFAEMMNKKAKEMGLKNTHFCTPSGLEIDGHEDECYSSAYDVARITAYSMRYKTIWNIFKIPGRIKIYSMNKKYSHEIFNTDRLLGEMPNCLGTKTGFTPLAGKSLMLAATDKTGRHKIIAVVLNDPQRWQDVKRMVNWAFNSYEWQ